MKTRFCGKHGHIFILVAYIFDEVEINFFMINGYLGFEEKIALKNNNNNKNVLPWYCYYYYFHFAVDGRKI